MSETQKREEKPLREVEVQKFKRRVNRRSDAAVEESIRKCGIALERGRREDYHFVAQMMRDFLAPTLVTEPLHEFHEELHETERWNWTAIHQFIDDPDKFVKRVSPHSKTPEEVGFGGSNPTLEAIMETIKQAFLSLEVIAENRGAIVSGLTETADAMGFEVKLGEHIAGYDVDLGDPVKIVSDDSGAMKSIHTGGTGQGKSSSTDMEAWDRYKRGNKVIDALDLLQGENFFYSTPQQDETLREARKDLGLPPAFADDEEPPEMEILVPMTESLEDEPLPFDTEKEEFVVKPFTVAASDLSERLLVSLIMSQLTPQQEVTVRNAYGRVDRATEDWTLQDLSDEIGQAEDLSDEMKARVNGVLESLQRVGFIRDSDSDHRIDWERIFREDRTITVFSCQYMDDLPSKLLATGYILRSIVEERKGLKDVAETTLVVREMWKVAPHSKRQAYDRKAASLQEAIGGMFSEIMREGRHHGIELLADTQHPRDLLKSIRELFNRYSVFNTNKSTVQDVFDWTGGHRWEGFYHSLTQKAGVSGIVGQTRPAVNRDHIEYVSPVKWAPPPFHHFDVDSDFEGGDSLARYHDEIELRTPAEEAPDWAVDIPLPKDLELDSAQSVERTPREQFVDLALEHTGSREDYAFTRDVRDAYQQFAEENPDAPDFKSPQSFGLKVKQAMITEFEDVEDKDDIDNHPRKREGDQEQAYIEFSLTEQGKDLCNRWRTDEDESSSPVIG